MNVARLLPIATLAFMAVSGPTAHAETAKELYFRCEKAQNKKLTFNRCVSEGLLADRKGLQADFKKRLEAADRFNKSGDTSLLDRSCSTDYLKFTKEKNRLRLFTCNERGECTPLTVNYSLILTEAQHDEIVRQTADIKKVTILGQEIIFSAGKVNAIPASCASPQGLCYKLFEKALGFSPEYDMTIGSNGTDFKRVDPSANDQIQGKKAYYQIQRRLFMSAPIAIYKARLPDLFSKRGTSLLAGLVDKLTSDEKIARVIYNIQMTNVLSKRLQEFASSRQKELRFVYLSENGLCSDTIHQDHLRPGMSIQEALIFRAKDESGDLTHTVGSSFLSVGNGFGRIFTGFLKDQVSVSAPAEAPAP